MTDDNSNPVDMDDLSAFESTFFGNEQPVEKVEEPQEENDVEDEQDVEENEDDDSLATDEDEGSDEPEDEEDDEESEPEPKAKKRNRTQERIEKLVAEARQAERERDAYLRELAALRAEKEVKTKEEKEVPVKELLSPDAPQPDAVDKDGNPVYPLGEFDPQFIADLTKFTITEQMKQAEKAKEEAARIKEIQLAQAAIQETWQENLEAAEERLPDIREKISGMVDAFDGIEPAYGEYLAGTIMSCEYGPEIMYYLSQNIGEAQKIVASGPAAATLAIGRIEAQFINAAKKEEDVKRNKKRVSDAPKPPEQRARGSHGRYAVRPDTDDLDAFERVFFGK